MGEGTDVTRLAMNAVVKTGWCVHGGSSYDSLYFCICWIFSIIKLEKVKGCKLTFLQSQAGNINK